MTEQINSVVWISAVSVAVNFKWSTNEVKRSDRHIEDPIFIVS